MYAVCRSGCKSWPWLCSLNGQCQETGMMLDVYDRRDACVDILGNVPHSLEEESIIECRHRHVANAYMYGLITSTGLV